MKINFNLPLQNLDSKDVLTPEGKKVIMGKELGNILVQSPKGDVLKHYEWAMKMNAGETIDLDTSDQETLSKFIKDHEAMSILFKAQLLACMKKQKEEDKPVKEIKVSKK